jgi:hypothetical protein
LNSISLDKVRLDFHWEGRKDQVRMSEREKGGTRLHTLQYQKLLVMVKFVVTFVGGHVLQECLSVVPENIRDRCFPY